MLANCAKLCRCSPNTSRASFIGIERRVHAHVNGHITDNWIRRQGPPVEAPNKSETSRSLKCKERLVDVNRLRKAVPSSLGFGGYGLEEGSAFRA